MLPSQRDLYSSIGLHRFPDRHQSHMPLLPYKMMKRQKARSASKMSQSAHRAEAEALIAAHGRDAASMATHPQTLAWVRKLQTERLRHSGK